MSYLVFCSSEIGGLFYKMTEILNRHGIEAYYISVDPRAKGHDSDAFHHGDVNTVWNLSRLFKGKKYFPKRMIKTLKQIKDEYKILYCLATGMDAYLLHHAGLHYKYWNYGTDLDGYCFSPYWMQSDPLWKNYWRQFRYIIARIRQRARSSICLADAVFIGCHQIKTLREVCSDKSLFHIPQIMNVIDYKPLMEMKLKSKETICKDIGAERYFFSATRHVWKGDWSRFAENNKANDIIMKTFAQYLNISRDLNTKLVFVKKGPDIGFSQELSRELGIDKYVVWVNEMKRTELDIYYQGAAICFGQFATPVVSFAVIEPITNATPCISFLDNIQHDVPNYKELPPIFNSKEPEKIADFIYKIINNLDQYSKLCYDSWFWAKNNCSEEAFVEAFKREIC